MLWSFMRCYGLWQKLALGESVIYNRESTLFLYFAHFYMGKSMSLWEALLMLVSWLQGGGGLEEVQQG